MYGTQTQVNMAYYKKSQKKVNGKWYPQGVTIGKPVQTKEVANRLADLSALSPGDCYSIWEISARYWVNT